MKEEKKLFLRATGQPAACIPALCRFSSETCREGTPNLIRTERAKWVKDIDSVYDIIHNGTLKAQAVTNETLGRVQRAMQVNYFEDRSVINEWNDLLKTQK